MSEYINRLIELSHLNFEFLVDYWAFHIGMISVFIIIEFAILEVFSQKKRKIKKFNIFNFNIEIMYIVFLFFLF